MCGFFGSFTKFNRLQKNFPEIQSLYHRGPDDEKNFNDGFLICKFFRLSIIGGKSESQPMVSYDKRWIILFNGEIYNFKELSKNINIDKKYGDTRVALEQFAKFGIDAVKKFNGMFAIALYDRIEKNFYLIRDRLGTKPLYYSYKNDAINFASEIKSIPLQKHVNEKMLHNYLEYGKYPTIKTFFKKIYNVEPSSILKFNKDGVCKYKYFDLLEQVKALKNENFSLEKFYSILKNSIQIRQRSDVKVNFHLSGGIDSTALLILTKDYWQRNDHLETFTFSYKGYEHDEFSFVKRISKKLGINNYKIQINPEEIPVLANKLQYYQDEPFGGLAAVAEYKLNLEQKKLNNIVSFEGMGGDEALGGYKSHFLLAIRDLYYSESNPFLLKQMIKYSGLNVKTILKLTNFFIESNFSGSTDLSEIRIKNNYKKNYKNNNWYNRIKFHDVTNGSLLRTLRFRDRSSAACSRELRFPLLDHNFLVYCLALPLNIKFANGLTKYPLRIVVKKHLKKDYLLSKRSVSAPQTFWLKKELKEWAIDNINSLRSKNIIEKKYFKKVNVFFKKKSNNSFFIWQLINLNLFYDNLKSMNKFYD